MPSLGRADRVFKLKKREIVSFAIYVLGEQSITPTLPDFCLAGYSW
jgi:hypothetical protein